MQKHITMPQPLVLEPEDDSILESILAESSSTPQIMAANLPDEELFDGLPSIVSKNPWGKDFEVFGDMTHPPDQSSMKKDRYTNEEVKGLVKGFKKFLMSGWRWIKIKDKYFKGSSRTKDDLKQKFKDMVKQAEKGEWPKDPELKELYVEALDLKARAPRDGRSERLSYY